MLNKAHFDNVDAVTSKSMFVMFGGHIEYWTRCSSANLMLFLLYITVACVI